MVLDRPEFGKLVGMYRGIVVQHLEFGRCKVWIPGVYPDKYKGNPDMLPPAEQLTPLFGGSGDGNGMFSYPKIGAVVACQFWNGDANHPVFFAATLGGEAAKSRYTEVRSNTTPETVGTGEDAYIHKIDVDQTTIKIWESGYMEIETRSDKMGTDKSKVTIDGKGNVIVRSTQQVQVTAPNINVIASDHLDLSAQTMKIQAGSQLDVITPKYCNMTGVSYNIISPAVNIDASTGAAVIKAKHHSSFFN